MNNIQPKKEHMSPKMMITLAILLVILIILIVAFLIVNIASSQKPAKVKTDVANQETTTVDETTEDTTKLETTTAAALETKSADGLTVPSGVTAPAFAFAEPMTFTVANTEGYGLSMRKGPSTGEDRITRISDGAKVTALGSSSTTSIWYYVEYNGEYGWCCSKDDGTTYLEK